MRIAIALMVVLAFCMGIAGISLAEDKVPAKPAAAAMASGPAKAMAGKPMPRASFNMLYGSVTKIDNSNPANVKLEVKNEADGAAHVVELTPTTNVTKVTDISELKAGDNVRVMARKVDNKEVAMGVMFGNIKRPAPRSVRPANTMTPPAAPAPQKQPKK